MASGFQQPISVAGRHSFEAVSGHLLIAAIGLEPGHADADRHFDQL